MALLSKQISEYTAKLCRENWMSSCDGLQGNLPARKTCYLLRHLIVPLSCKSSPNSNLTKVLDVRGDG